MMFALKILGPLAGAGSTAVGLLLYFGGDNSDARALAHFVSYPFLAIGAVLLVVSILALVL